MGAARYELWRMDSGDLYAIKLQPCAEFVVCGEGDEWIYSDRVRGYLGPLELTEETLREMDLRVLPYEWNPDEFEYDMRAASLDMMRPDVTIIARVSGE